jgi:hypothetical protein
MAADRLSLTSPFRHMMRSCDMLDAECQELWLAGYTWRSLENMSAAVEA